MRYDDHQQRAEPVETALEVAAAEPHYTRTHRILVEVREVASIALLLTATVLLVLLINGLGWFADRVDPAPTVTECVGEVPC